MSGIDPRAAGTESLPPHIGQLRSIWQVNHFYLQPGKQHVHLKMINSKNHSWIQAFKKQGLKLKLIRQINPSWPLCAPSRKEAFVNVSTASIKSPARCNFLGVMLNWSPHNSLRQFFSIPFKLLLHKKKKTKQKKTLSESKFGKRWTGASLFSQLTSTRTAFVHPKWKL